VGSWARIGWGYESQRLAPHSHNDPGDGWDIKGAPKWVGALRARSVERPPCGDTAEASQWKENAEALYQSLKAVEDDCPHLGVGRPGCSTPAQEGGGGWRTAA